MNFDISNLLPKECNLVFRINVPGNHELLTALMETVGISSENVDLVLERTNIATIGLEMNKTDMSLWNTPIHAVALGNWPRGIMGNILGKDWSRVTLKQFLWRGPDDKEVLAISKDLLLMSHGRMDSMQESFQAGGQVSKDHWNIPDADIAILLKNVDFISHLLPQVQGRIQSLTLALIRDGSDSYSIVMNLKPIVEKQAKSLALGLRLALSVQFGKSSLSEEKDLLSRTTVDINNGIIRMEINKIGMGTLTTMASKLKNKI